MQAGSYQQARSVLAPAATAQAFAPAETQVLVATNKLRDAKQQLAQLHVDTSPAVRNCSEGATAEACNGVPPQQPKFAEPNQAADAVLPNSASQGPPAFAIRDTGEALPNVLGTSLSK